MALTLNFTNQRILFPLALLSMLLLNSEIYRLFLHWKFLAFLGLLVFAVPLFTGEKDAVIVGIEYSSEILRSSIVMAERSIILLMGLKHFTSRISVEQIAQAMANSRFKRFSQVFSLSMQVLPEVKSITIHTFREYRDESDKKKFLPNIYDFSIKLMVRILHCAGNYSQQNSMK
jgi:hypothetical protein